MITFCTLFSGSSGNAAVLCTDEGAVLIDCGMSGKQILAAMAAARLNPGDLKALLVTHEHSDHVKGVGVISRKLDLPVYATEGTWQGMEASTGPLKEENRVVITPGESFFLQNMEIAPFSIPHDAAEPVGYRFYLPGHSVAVATDLGYFSQTVRDAVLGAELVLLESNHDPELLRHNPNYPAALKNRILGKKGHLSNESGAGAAVELAQNGARHLLLGHLSRENNTPDMAYQTTRDALETAGAEIGRDVTLRVAARDSVSALYTIA
ncbi:MAG: MBL fold metallo-hydrolase [Eubacteriales bacterium]|nr:MBL fold metallo-hydrolase [Eubacteriales bacterium]